MPTDQELYQQYLQETGQNQDDLYRQYLEETGQVNAKPATPPTDKVVNEMPEGLEGRFVYKNFGADPVAAFNYLEKQNPDFELKKDSKGEILARKRGTETWGRLDPKGFDWRDLTDVAYDVPAAVAQGAATAASGIAGGAATLPTGGWGAIPAAMAGSGASGTALEGVRQTIGRALGIEDNFSADEAKLAAVTGTLSPLLFGTGAGTKEALKYAAKEGLADDAARALLKSQSGVAGKAYDKAAGYVGPKIASLVSGENSKVIKKAAEMLPEIKAADKNPEIRSLPLKEVAQEVPKKIKAVTTETGQRMEDLRGMIDNQPGIVLAGEGASRAQGTIPAAQFMEPFQELAAKISQGGAGTEAQLKDAASLAKIIESEFKGLPENLTAAQVDTLRKRFKERAQQYGLNYGKSGQASGTMTGSAIDSQIASAFESSRKRMNDSIIEKLEALGGGLGEEYSKLSDQYSFLKNVAKENNNKFKTSKSVSDFLARSTKDDLEAQNLLDIQQITGVDLGDLAARDQALRTFSKPSSEIRSLAGSTSTSRSIPLAVAGGAAGYYAGQQSGGDYSPFLLSVLGAGLGSKMASPAALRKYMEANSVMRNAPKVLPGYKTLPYLMMNPELHDQGEK